MLAENAKPGVTVRVKGKNNWFVGKIYGGIFEDAQNDNALSVMVRYHSNGFIVKQPLAMLERVREVTKWEVVPE